MAFMLFDITISCVACARQNERKHDIPPKNSFDVFLDNKYPDEFMDKIYNNRILIEKKDIALSTMCYILFLFYNYFVIFFTWFW